LWVVEGPRLINYLLAAAVLCVAVIWGDIANAQRVSDVKDSVLADVTALPDALDVEKSTSDFVIAPIPISNPTIGTGLAVATAPISVCWDNGGRFAGPEKLPI